MPTKGAAAKCLDQIQIDQIGHRPKHPQLVKHFCLRYTSDFTAVALTDAFVLQIEHDRYLQAAACLACKNQTSPFCLDGQVVKLALQIVLANA